MKFMFFHLERCPVESVVGRLDVSAEMVLAMSLISHSRLCDIDTDIQVCLTLF